MKSENFDIVLDDLVQRLIELRKGKKLSHEKLVKLSGVSRTAISYMEARKTTPSIVTVMKVCHAMDVKLSDLLKEVSQ